MHDHRRPALQGRETNPMVYLCPRGRHEENNTEPQRRQYPQSLRRDHDGASCSVVDSFLSRQPHDSNQSPH